MLQQIIGLPDHLRTALAWELELGVEPDGVVLVGMGGSAVGADMLADYACPIAHLPICVVRGLQFPGWVGKRTLVVMVSYSGNTWEVMDLYAEARRRGCQMASIASGGELAKRSEMDGVPMLKVPQGLQPRAALGYLLGAEAVVLEASGVVPAKRELNLAQTSLASLREEVLPSVPTDSNLAKSTALKLHRKVPVVYAPRNLRTVAYRWQTQINENAKMMAFSGEFPEMNHNQLVPWVEGNPGKDLAPVFLRPSSSEGNLGEKMEVAMQLMRESTAPPRSEKAGKDWWANFRDGQGKAEPSSPGPKVDPLPMVLSGNTQLETALRGIMLGDFVSYYLAMLKGVDPSPVASIQELKRRMR